MSENKLTHAQASLLLYWYNQQGRDLPWRKTNDPYDVWLSEIMLQQTRVEAVMERFVQFKAALPKLSDLAAVDEQTLLKLWEGMGYYNRARNLKRCAEEVMQKHHGVFPETQQELKALPGIGPYTSGAIAAIAFERPAAAVDGNVLRVFARLFDDPNNIKDPCTRKKYETVIETLYQQDLPLLKKQDPHAVSHLTQAWMDLGATICIPVHEPRCSICPLKSTCLSLKHDTCRKRPVSIARKTRRTEERTIILVHDSKKLYLTKRDDTGLLKNMYEPMCLSSHLSKTEVESILSEKGFQALRIQAGPSYVHRFTHVEWNCISYDVQIGETDHKGFYTEEEMRLLPIASAYAPFLKK